MQNFSEDDKPFFIITLIIVLAIGVTFGYLITRSTPRNQQQELLCAQDVKLCPDGSYVSRVGRNCEFAQCQTGSENNQTPQNQTGAENWQTFADYEQGSQYKYPEKVPANYIYGNVWPPKINEMNGNYSCNTATSSPLQSVAQTMTERIINNKTYCIQMTVGAAAGSTYNSYTYSTQNKDKIISANFTLQYPQCLNYNEPQKTECRRERETFNLDNLIDQIVSSIQPIKS